MSLYTGLEIILNSRIVRRDSLLPRHHVRHCRPITAWLICTAALLLTVATVAVSYAAWQAERARFSAFFEAQQVVNEKITITYDANGIVCTVPRGQERAAAVVNQGCNALAGALKAAGVIK